MGALVGASRRDGHHCQVTLVFNRKLCAAHMPQTIPREFTHMIMVESVYVCSHLSMAGRGCVEPQSSEGEERNRGELTGECDLDRSEACARLGLTLLGPSVWDKLCEDTCNLHKSC